MRKALFLILTALLLSGCARREYAWNMFAMDTVMDFKIYSANNDATIAAEGVINHVDALLDRGNPESEIYKINENHTAEVSEATADMIRAAIDISKRTNGAFDVTTAPLSDLWGFYGSNFRVPSNSEVKTALSGVGYEKIAIRGNTITIPENTKIDLGGIGKGCASDWVTLVLKNNGVKSAIISLGGNVHAIGSRVGGGAWTVGITDPSDTSQILGTVKVKDKAVVTSGGYQRNFTENGVTYHHIIDPKTGKSANSGLTSVTIISDSGITADGLSTALFVMGLDSAETLWRSSNDFEAVFVGDNGKITVTEGIKDAFYCDREYEILKRVSS